MTESEIFSNLNKIKNHENKTLFDSNLLELQSRSVCALIRNDTNQQDFVVNNG